MGFMPDCVLGPIPFWKMSGLLPDIRYVIMDNSILLLQQRWRHLSRFPSKVVYIPDKRVKADLVAVV